MSSWLDLKTYFEQDDGFLPEVSVEGYRSHEIVTLPDLGVFIFENEIILDYRRGSEWTDEVISTFFALISKVMTPRPEIAVKHQECEALFEKYLARSA